MLKKPGALFRRRKQPTFNTKIHQEIFSTFLQTKRKSRKFKIIKTCTHIRETKMQMKHVSRWWLYSWTVLRGHFLSLESRNPGGLGGPPISHFVRIEKAVNVRVKQQRSSDSIYVFWEQHSWNIWSSCHPIFDQLKHSASTKNLFYPLMSWFHMTCTIAA